MRKTPRTKRNRDVLLHETFPDERFYIVSTRIEGRRAPKSLHNADTCFERYRADDKLTQSASGKKETGGETGPRDPQRQGKGGHIPFNISSSKYVFSRLS